jgi:hypothetical protein
VRYRPTIHAGASLLNQETYSTTASSSCEGEHQTRSAISSVLKVSTKLSAIALSEASPTVPTDARTPWSVRVWVCRQRCIESRDRRGRPARRALWAGSCFWRDRNSALHWREAVLASRRGVEVRWPRSHYAAQVPARPLWASDARLRDGGRRSTRCLSRRAGQAPGGLAAHWRTNWRTASE